MKKNRLTGKVIVITLATLLGLGIVVSGATYLGMCIKNGSDKTHETIKGWFDNGEVKENTPEGTEEEKDSTPSDSDKVESGDTTQEVK